jgi:hypothetical protein
VPPIRIEFMPETLDETVAEKLMEVLRTDAAERFSVPSRQLTPGDMTVIFDELHPWSEPTHDIVVRMDLHNDPHRLAKDIDAEAGKMAKLIANALEELKVDEDVTIGVALMYGPIGWGTAVARRNNTTVGGR